VSDVEKIRLFVAVSLPEAVLGSLDAALAPLRTQLRNARWVKPENQHLTLKFLGWAPSDRLEEIARVCTMVATGHEATTLTLTELGAFPSKRRVRVLWMGIEDERGSLARIATDLDSGFEALGFPTEGRDYAPHLTVARFKLPVPLKSGFPELAAPSHDPIVIDRLDLYRSHLSPKGARYEAVGSFPLGSG